MATTTNETTVSIEYDGKKTEPVTLSEFERRTDQAIDRLRGEQLSFDTGAGFKAAPDFATLKIAGQFGVERDLRYKEAVTITVTDANGELLTTSPATIGWPSFKDKTTGELTFTERAHTATID
jgi:hypothetical protein